MTQQKQRNPDIDFGFFAQIPRVIRTDYKSLTSVQKWLYVCLKDLCGETGTCYRTLRVLADETGISTGMLSESIAALHKEGLIHAEKKKRSIGGKEVWHITIADIWKANARSHPTKRSHSEQTIENVHSVNNNVHHVNDTTPECSHSELECSHSETEGISSEAISFTEEISGEEREREVADATARSQSSSEKFADAGFYSPMPMTYNEALAYLVPHGPHEGLDAVQVVKLAQKLWTEAHEDDEDTVTARSQDQSLQERVAEVFGQYLVLNGIHLKVKLPADDETEKRRAIKPSQKGQIDADANHHRTPNQHSDHAIHHPLGTPDDTHRATPPQLKENTNKVTQPPAPRKPPTNPVPRRPKQQGLMDELPSSPASKPVEPHAEMAWGTRKCLQWFDYWRGGVLIAKYKLQQAASCAKGLAEQFDEATVVRIRGDMADDPYYIERGGPDICDVANNIHKYLNKKKPKKEPSNEHKATSFYSADALSERNKWKMETFLAEYEAKAGATQEVQS